MVTLVTERFLANSDDPARQPNGAGEALPAYLREIRPVLLLTADAEVTYAKAIEGGRAAHEDLRERAAPAPDEVKRLEEQRRLGRDARRRLVEANLRLVVSVARRYINRGIALDKMVAAVNSFTTGWVTYYRHAQCRRTLVALDGWLRRKLRCVRLKHCKRVKAIADFLQANGVRQWRAWLLALSGKGWWRMAGSPQATEAMTIAWFDKLGLIRLTLHHATLAAAGNRRGT